jgi:sterol desaturase/sphingolipid hydroxylase (fatty acid hydroxylase superfamily)
MEVPAPRRPGLRINQKQKLGSATLTITVLIILLAMTLPFLFLLIWLVLPMLRVVLTGLAAVLALAELTTLLILFFHIVCHKYVLLNEGAKVPRS